MGLEREPFYDDIEYPNAFGHEDEVGESRFAVVKLNRVVLKLYSFDGDFVITTNGAQRIIRGGRIPTDIMDRQSESRGLFLERFIRESGEAAIIPDVVARELKNSVAASAAHNLFIFRIKQRMPLLERLDGSKLSIINNSEFSLRRPKNWEASALSHQNEIRVP